MDYRREIDGLRAFAVLPVILFHAGFETFGGGFVGVDVFFVISGYLITTIILAELEQDKFSIINFYERRARRIFPALFLVMLVCIPLAWLWLLPDDIKSFSKSLAAASVFSSNILFWREGGYFDASVEFKPLLHTWSLAVEEQYYILFPLVLLLLWKTAKRWILVVFGLAFIASLAAAQWAVYIKPIAAFYLLPTRGWELLTGALVAFYLSKTHRKNVGSSLSEFAGWLGVALILYAVFEFNQATLFPGFHALVPTLGAVLIILFATQQTSVGKFLGNKFFVGIGLLSYSAYLWHQPLFAFARHRSVFEPSPFLFFSLSVLALALAYLSWRFVETPFGNKQRYSRNAIFIMSLVGGVFFLALGMVGQVYSDKIVHYKSKASPEMERSYDLYKSARDTSPVFIESNRFDNGDCQFSVTNLNTEVASRLVRCFHKYGAGLLVFGDSHATNLYHSIISNKANLDYSFLVGITKNGCHLPTNKAGCQYQEISSFLQKHPDTFRFAVYEKAGYLMLDFGGVKANLRERLRDASSDINVSVNSGVIAGVGDYLASMAKYTQVIWFGPRLEPLVTSREFMKFGCLGKYVPTNQQRHAFENLDAVLNVFSVGKRWKYVSQLALIKYNYPADFGDCNRLLWMDMNHFSKEGEAVFGSRFTIDDLIK